MTFKEKFTSYARLSLNPPLPRLAGPGRDELVDITFHDLLQRKSLKLALRFMPSINKRLGLRSKSSFAEGYFQSYVVIWLLALSVIANISNWVVLKLFIKPVDFPIILHYNVYFGVDMVGSWKQVYFLPALGIGLFLVNAALSVYFYRQKERIASYLLLLATLMIQLSLIVASVSVIIINY